MERRLKKSVLYSLVGLGCLGFIGLIYGIESAILKNNVKDDDLVYVSKTILSDVVPVIGESSKIIKPYVNQEVKIYKTFYQKDGNEEEQKNAIIEYGNTYLQSSGICYSLDKQFDVVAIMDGTVIDIKDDELLGKVIEIRHDNNVISTYQGLSEVSVEKDMQVKSGDMIGISGTSNIFKDAGNHLYFELAVNGKLVNPNDYYDKTLGEI